MLKKYSELGPFWIWQSDSFLAESDNWIFIGTVHKQLATESSWTKWIVGWVNKSVDTSISIKDIESHLTNLIRDLVYLTQQNGADNNANKRLYEII